VCEAFAVLVGVDEFQDVATGIVGGLVDPARLLEFLECGLMERILVAVRGRAEFVLAGRAVREDADDVRVRLLDVVPRRARELAVGVVEVVRAPTPRTRVLEVARHDDPITAGGL